MKYIYEHYVESFDEEDYADESTKHTPFDLIGPTLVSRYQEVRPSFWEASIFFFVSSFSEPIYLFVFNFPFKNMWHIYKFRNL
mgnify:CR=1 FL=1